MKESERIAKLEEEIVSLKKQLFHLQEENYCMQNGHSLEFDRNSVKYGICSRCGYEMPNRLVRQANLR